MTEIAHHSSPFVHSAAIAPKFAWSFVRASFMLENDVKLADGWYPESLILHEVASEHCRSHLLSSLCANTVAFKGCVQPIGPYFRSYRPLSKIPEYYFAYLSFPVSLGTIVSPKRKYNAYAKFWRTNKEYYGIFDSSQVKTKIPTHHLLN